MTKAKLRKTYLGRRNGLPGAERLEKSRQIADRFFESFDLTRVRVLHSFVSIERFNEVDTSLILRTVWTEHLQIETVVPRVNFETGDIDSLNLRPDTELAQSFWGIPEPAHDEILPVSAVDMVLVPGLAFDAAGHRVGYGKGFYDRFLSRCRPDCVKIGLSFFEPVKKIAGTHAGDVRLDWLITPHNAISCL